MSRRLKLRLQVHCSGPSVCRTVCGLYIYICNTYRATLLVALYTCSFKPHILKAPSRATESESCYHYCNLAVATPRLAVQRVQPQRNLTDRKTYFPDKMSRRFNFFWFRQLPSVDTNFETESKLRVKKEIDWTGNEPRTKTMRWIIDLSFVLNIG